MSLGPEMSDAQKAILSKKIAIAEARAAAENSRIALALEALTEALGGYFAIKLKPPALRLKSLDKAQLAGSARAGAWYLFRAGATDIAVALDNKLIVAAAEAALRRPFDQPAGIEPTAIDRSIAAALAGRIAATCWVQAAASPDEPLTLAQITPLAEDIKFAKETKSFQCYALCGVALGPDLHVEALCAIAGERTAAKGGSAPQGGVWAPVLSAVAATAPVRVRCLLGAVEATFGAVLDLTPGVVFSIRDGEATKARLVCGPTEIGRGALGEFGGKRAIRMAT
jgi:hypothetical protein